MPTPEIIEGEFQVIVGDAPEITPPPYVPTRWSFWRDDWPTLWRMLLSVILAILLKAWLFPHVYRR